jgi:type I restriction enzyme S subunit
MFGAADRTSPTVSYVVCCETPPIDTALLDATAARQKIAALDRSVLQRHFSGSVVIPLGEVITDISAGRSFGESNTAAAEGEWGIIKVSAMTWGEFRASENKAVAADMVDPRFEIHKGDLLVSRANTPDYLGASVLVGPVRPKLLLSDKSLRLTPKTGVRAAWLWRALQAPSARSQITALATGTKASMRNISQSALREVLLPVADESAQAAALEAFDGVAVATAHLRTEIARCELRAHSLRRALLDAAFSGRLIGGSEPPNDEVQSALRTSPSELT